MPVLVALFIGIILATCTFKPPETAVDVYYLGCQTSGVQGVESCPTKLVKLKESYRVLISDQMVIARFENSILTLDDCSVFDHENWVCTYSPETEREIESLTLQMKDGQLSKFVEVDGVKQAAPSRFKLKQVGYMRHLFGK